MTHTALLLSCVLIANGVYVTAGVIAGRQYGLHFSVFRGMRLAILLAGTVIGCIAVLVTPNSLAEALLIAGFGAVVVGAACDVACGYVFDAVTLPSVLAMLAVSLFAHDAQGFAVGAASGGGVLAALYAITRGRGIGLGDVKLGCCIGGAAGALPGMEAIGIAFVIGGVYASYLLASRRATRETEIRFAPYLAAGMSLVVLHGKPL